MQKTIDDLLAQIEAEKQNMGAAGKKREEELLAKIEALRKDLSLRDVAIKEHLNTIEDQNQKILDLEATISSLNDTIADLQSQIDALKRDLDMAQQSGDEAT